MNDAENSKKNTDTYIRKYDPLDKFCLIELLNVEGISRQNKKEGNMKTHYKRKKWVSVQIRMTNHNRKNR